MIIKSNLENNSYLQDGILIQEKIGKAKNLGVYDKLSITKICVDSGFVDKCHYHKISDELYCVVSGAIELCVDGVNYTLQTGDCALIEPSEKHFVIGKSEKSEVIVLCTPAWDKDDSFYD